MEFWGNMQGTYQGAARAKVAPNVFMVGSYHISLIFTVCCTLMFFCLVFSPSPSSAKGEIDLRFKGQIISADLQGVSLKLILDELKTEKEIWFEGNESLLGEKVSVRFKDLPLEEGLNRILADINHVLVFDQDKRVVGLLIIGKKNPGRPRALDAVIVTEKAPPSQPVEDAPASRNPFEIFRDGPPRGNPKTELRDTTIRKNFSPPEDPKAETSDTPFTKMSSSPENPFAGKISGLSENPFARNTPPSFENPFVGKGSPEARSPFGGNVPSSKGSPFDR